MTLRQEIETIENNVLYAKDRVDRICEAVLKMAEGTPKRSTILIHTGNDRFVVPTLETRKQLQQIEDAEKEYLSECQAYWQKELGK